jgi:hypothetical protein
MCSKKQLRFPRKSEVGLQIAVAPPDEAQHNSEDMARQLTSLV